MVIQAYKSLYRTELGSRSSTPLSQVNSRYHIHLSETTPDDTAPIRKPAMYAVDTNGIRKLQPHTRWNYNSIQPTT